MDLLEFQEETKPFLVIGEPRVPLLRDGHEIAVRICYHGFDDVYGKVRKTLFGANIYFDEGVPLEQIPKLLPDRIEDFKKMVCEQIMAAKPFQKS